jgi:type IV pilus assembly protein PilO
MTKMSLSNIHEWPLMTKLLVFFLVFCASLYLGYRYDLSSQILKLSRAEQQEVDLKQQIDFVIQKNNLIKLEVGKLPEMQAELGKWEKQLVDYNELPEVLNQILKLGGDNHLFFSLFSPGASMKVTVEAKPEEKPADAAAAAPAAAPAPAPAPTDAAAAPAPPEHLIQFDKVPIKVVVVGSYHQLADFISQVANMPYVVAIGNFTISNENQTGLLGETLAKQAQEQHLLTAELALDVYHTGESK